MLQCELAHGGRPISQKVSDLMHECTSAIVIFTADEKYKDNEGTEYYRPSDKGSSKTKPTRRSQN